MMSPPSFVPIPALPARRMLPFPARNRLPQAIARKVSDIRHYPAGTDKAAAREIRAKEKRIARKSRQKLRETPHGYGDRPGAGIFPYGSAERTNAERDAYHSRMDPAQRDAALRYAGMLSGGKADLLLHTLRARWLERVDKMRYERPFILTSDVRTLYDKLIDEILLCDSLYYAPEPEPRVTDDQYDELVMHLLELERCFPQLIQPRSPSQNVGHGAAARATKLGLDNELAPVPINARSSFMKTVPVTTKLFPQHKHKALMLSLDNAYKHDDLVAFEKRAREAGSTLSAELKVDGVALSVEYRRRQMFLAATRGTGRIGDDVTVNVREALLDRGLVASIDNPDAPDWLIIRGEVYITPKDFEVVNSELDKPLSNPRNAAAGALKHKDPMEAKARRVRFVAYECLTGRLEDAEQNDSRDKTSDSLPSTHHMWTTQEETLKRLADWGLGGMPRFTVCSSVAEAESFAVAVEDDRENLGMEVDGIVFKFNDSAARESAGHTARAPRGAIAYKFAAQARVTKVNDVAMQVSRCGIITPVAVLEPVRVGGAVLSRATLHNFDEIKRLGVAVGDIVRIERGGDVIPKVIEVDQRSNAPDRKEISPPERCPSCGGETMTRQEKSGAVLVGCLNSVNCRAQTLGRLIHFCGRDAMDIQGLGKKTAEKLASSGVVVSPADLFRLTIDDLLSLDGFAEKSAATLFEAIRDAATSRSLERLIVGLGLPGVGRTGAKALAVKVGSLEGLIRISDNERGYEDLMATSNIAEKSANIVHEHLRKEKVRSELVALKAVVAPRLVVDEEDENVSEGQEVASIAGKRFVFTGKFVTMSRPHVMKWIRKCGGTVASDVSKKTDYVISGFDPGNKFFKAQRLKVKTLQEVEFFEFFDVSAEEYEPLLIQAKEKNNPSK